MRPGRIGGVSRGNLKRALEIDRDYPEVKALLVDVDYVISYGRTA